MPDENQTIPTAAAITLHTDYAHAIDTRDWDLFARVFTPDVRVRYTAMPPIDGIDDWLAFFIPFHDQCGWTLHAMTNHRVGTGPDGIWASCYGDVRWTQHDQPSRMHHAIGIYQDTLTHTDSGWRISSRRMDVLLSATTDISASTISLPTSVRDVSQPPVTH
ncbi:MAG: nuclear transport factor 2 family protein [Gordonia sp. (in: high G+C Gram-positive bacteria)]